MSIEPIADPKAEEMPREISKWRKFVVWMQAFDEAMTISYDEIQDRRILALENEVAKLVNLSSGKRNPSGEA